MRKLMTGVALAAVWSAGAWAQVQADFEHQTRVDAERLFETEGLDTIVNAATPTALDEEVIVAADRLGFAYERDLTVPATILTQDDIESRGQLLAADLLRALPGISVSTSGSATGLTQLRVRGAEANQVLVLVDGVEAANPSTGEFNLAGLRASDIVKIEVLRGEQSALYGSDAVAGVISIVTRAGETKEQWRLNLEGGSRDTFEGQVTGILPLGEASLSLNASGLTTQGFDVSGLDGERDGAETRTLNLGLNRVELGPVRFDVKFETAEIESEYDEDSDFNGRLDNTASVVDTQTDIARADARFATGALDHKVSVGWTETEVDTRASFATRTRGERLTATYVGGWSNETHSLTGLAEAERETYRIVPNFTESGAEPENDTGAVALDYRFTNDALTLSASGRYDVNDLFEDAATWRLGAGLDLPWDGRVRASVGTGIKNPSLIELFGFFPASRFTGNADLQPEESLGVSVGYEQEIGRFSGSVDVFRSELRNEIATVFGGAPDFASTVVNLDTNSTRQGVELEASYRGRDWDVQASATVLDSEENGITEIRRPEFTASASARWEVTEAIVLSAFVDHTGSQTDTDFATFSPVTLDSFTLVGARAEVAVGEVVSVHLRGTNLLDEDYQEVVGFASPGRAVFAGVSADF